MSVIRLNGEEPARIVSLADRILQAWRAYTDESAFIFAETDGEKHSTITPIARRRDGRYELDLVLRNNIQRRRTRWVSFIRMRRSTTSRRRTSD